MWQPVPIHPLPPPPLPPPRPNLLKNNIFFSLKNKIRHQFLFFITDISRISIAIIPYCFQSSIDGVPSALPFTTRQSPLCRRSISVADSFPSISIFRLRLLAPPSRFLRRQYSPPLHPDPTALDGSSTLPPFDSAERFKLHQHPQTPPLPPPLTLHPLPQMPHFNNRPPAG